MPRSIFETSRVEADTINIDASPLARLHGDRLPHFPETPFSRLFEQQVDSRPQAIAVVCEEQQLTFNELNARANQLARHLQGLGIGRGSIVGVCIDRSVEMAIAIIATVKAGAAYLPLDPEYPRDRLAFMLADAKPALVLAKESLQIDLPPESVALMLDRDWPAISRNSNANLSDAPAKDDLAYVIYTSGSTGKPKGVCITHGNLSNYLRALNHEFKIGSADLYLHTASIAFSSSRRQLLLPLSRGAGVAIATSHERKDPIALFRMIKSRSVTVMDAVPSMWHSCTTILRSLPADERRQLLDNRLRLMLSASEPLLSEIPRTWMSEFNHPAEHIHMFGQTETAGIVALFHIPRDFNSETYVPVGKPIANTDIFVLDENGDPCATGEAGELYIGGAGVGRGYLNQPQLTAEKFIERNGERVYRSGDWARISAPGQLESAGRRDQQVKLRGFRVELGEVEAVLSRHPGVRECAAVARDQVTTTGSTDKRLIAYFVSRNGAVNVNDLRSFLSTHLPDYSVPSAFVEMQAMPLSANGKIDRRALPEPENARAAVAAEFVAPQSEIEIRLARIWGEVLSTDAIGRDDNFFELGGHSLLAAQIAARIRRQFDFEAPISALFEFPTIELLAARIARGGEESVVRSIKRADCHGTAPLSFNQQQFWLLDQVTANRASYNVQTGLKISGPLQIKKLQSALDAIISRHEILRTNIIVENGSPLQRITESLSIPVDVIDLSNVSNLAAERDRVLAEETRVFDLSRDPLLRACLLKFGEGDHELVLTLHHIVCDGWSIGVLLRELTHLYLHGTASGIVPDLPIQYADFAIWQRRWLQDETIGRQLDYWKRQLADAPTALDLPTDYLRSTIQTFKGGRVSANLPPDLVESIKMLGRNENATLFMTLLAAFQTLLFRYSGQEDVVVGSPVAGRTMVETENLIGAFVNTLVLRGDLRSQPTFREFLARVRQTVMGAFCHQDLPFEKLVEELNPERKANRSPLFQVMFSYQNVPAPQLAVNGVKFTNVDVASDTAKFDLTLDVSEAADGIWISFEYAKDLFATATIERMLAHFENLLRAIVSDPAQRVNALPLLTDAERRQLLVEWNDNSLETPQDKCVQELFEAQVAKSPDAIAAEFKAERITYRELNARANQLAHHLRALGVGPEKLIGVSVPRSIEMLVAILGVMKAGAGYVPLDPNYPHERLQFMIEDAELPLVIATRDLAGRFSDCAPVLAIDDDWSLAHDSFGAPPSGGMTAIVTPPKGGTPNSAVNRDENVTTDVAPDNVAYVIYTSGSTGNPKGVAVEHRSLANFTETSTAAYGLRSEDRILQFASLSFDLSAEEIYPALTHGATVVLRTDEMINSPRDFLRYCDEWKLTVLDLPTAYWHELTDALSPGDLQLPARLRLVIIGGEKASIDRVNKWQQVVGNKVRLLNTYGPTETTIAVTLSELRAESPPVSGAVSIGRPFANTSLYVLDRLLQPVPIGVAGELYIGGPGVARGYVNRPELTADKFIRSPFAVNSNDRLYKTGDVVRYRGDGSLEFLGRADNQIKIRGFRVELEDIEQTLRQHDAVKDCVVVFREDLDARLIAYVVANRADLASELRTFVKSKLPGYMVPATFEMIAALPLAPSGKINRRALPEPKSVEVISEAFVAPSTPLEELLASAWQDVLRIPRVSVHDNFFDIGGHSLLAARVVSIVNRSLTVDFGMVDLFQDPTIALLAETLSRRVAERESQPEFEKLLAEVAAMSEEEARQFLNSELIRSEAAA